MDIHNGLVENNIDPKREGRLKIRVFGVYDNIPTDNIPWSNPLKTNDGKIFNIPAIGKIVSVIFIKNDIYSPYYINSINYNINLKNKLNDLDDDDYTNFSALLYDHRTQIYSDNEELKFDYYFNNVTIDKSGVHFDLKDNNQVINLGDRYNCSQQSLFGNHWLEWFDKIVQELLNPLSLVGNLGAPITKTKLDTILSEYLNIRKTFLSNNVLLVDNNEILEDKTNNKRKLETKTYTHDLDLKINNINIIDTEISEKILTNSVIEQNKINEINTIDADPENLNMNNISTTEQLKNIKNDIDKNQTTSTSDYKIEEYNNSEYVDKNATNQNDNNIIDCDDFKNDINYNMKISNHFTLANLSTNAVVSSYKLKNQKGLNKEQIACNLKDLAVNVLDKIKDKYPSMFITSGFRHGSGNSQHNIGQAVDMQFSGKKNKDYKDIADWISKNVDHDQLLLEYKNRGTRLPWIHISYKKKLNRSISLTFFNDSSKNPGGTGLINLAGNHGIPV